MTFVVLRFMQGWTVSGMVMVTVWMEGQTERQMIGWEEGGRVDGSEEGGECPDWWKDRYTSDESVVEEPTESEMNVRCLCS
jgi:hypothetical protein